MENNESMLYAGPPQRWAVNFSNGLEYVNTIDGLLAGRLRVFSYPLINFKTDPFVWEDFEKESTNETTKFYLHSLKWIDQLIQDAIDKTETSSESGALALTFAKEWWENNILHQKKWAEDEYIWGGHGFALRATTLVGLSELYPSETWLREAVGAHLRKLVTDFDGYWNHGLAQALALICTASRLGDEENLRLGAQRTTACLDEMVDEHGCINEQAPEYARYIERLIRVSIRVFRHNNIGNPEALQDKKEKIREFIGHSTTPGGTFVELGDSVPRRPTFMNESPAEYVLSNGARGVPIPNTKVYDQGFVFGRSGFGSLRHPSEETYYTLRFGPQRIIHGHNDHLSLTYWAEGRNVIVDPGHVGYSPGPDRTYVRSHAAHNVVVARDRKHDWSAHTSLTAQGSGENWQSFVLTDEAYKDLPRTRATCFSDCGPFVVYDAVDGLESAPYLTQRWNVAPEFQFKGSNAEAVWFESVVDGLKFYILRYRIVGDDLHQSTSVDLSFGDREKMLGLVARNDDLVPAWNVGFGATTNEYRVITAGFVVPADSSVGWSFRESSPGIAVLRIHIGPKSWAFDCNISDVKISGRSIPTPVRYGGEGIKHG
ncbi:heparinase II/III domain-containing protein [Corynebacterium sp. A21]|uniref:heparinase II/III domain-containing protein n=1 Tax=Corynebacterium sp. A21 TaxID=3457318 RepID=UPI003FD60F82